MKKFLMLLLVAMFLFCPILTAEATGGRVQETQENIVVVIDPGHGGENEGTIEHPYAENGFREKDMTMITAMAMYEELSKYENITVYLTRSDDKDLSLKERAEFAAQVGADFLFSIHYNASVNHNYFGTEVWISSQAPYNAYGYQFAHIQLTAMEEQGLFLRGVKTRLNDRQTDYYGILRESTLLGIPAVLLEHCHVDEDRDIPFCDTQEELAALGRADATAVAKYFGLKSDQLFVDYSDYPRTLLPADPNIPVETTLKDETPPEVCLITLLDTDYENGTVQLEVSAADYESVLLYYDYSIDGGATYSSLLPWPGSNARTGKYDNIFTLTLLIPSGVTPQIIFRSYNLYDICAESNQISDFPLFTYGEGEEILSETEELPSKEGEIPLKEGEIPSLDAEPAVVTWGSSYHPEKTREEDSRLLSLLILSIIAASTVLLLILLLQFRRKHNRRKRR